MQAHNGAMIVKFLIISHAYDPTVSPRAIRWAQIAVEWVGKGHEVDVVTSRKPELAGKEKLNGVGVHRVGNAASEMWRDRVKERNIERFPEKRPAASSKKAKHFSGAAKKSLSLLLWIRRHTWKQLWWPDSSCLWYFPARKKAERLLRGKDYDAMITVSLPFTGHLVGLHLKRRFPARPWIADSGDPFCYLDKPVANNQRLYARKNYSVESDVFHLADSVTVTTAETSQRYANLFPECVNKLRVIPPLLTSSNAEGKKSTLFAGDGAIRLVYIGRVYRENRNPEFLLELFHRLLASRLGERLELHFFGPAGDCAEILENYKILYGNKLHLHGNVGHATALQAMEEADILVNIGNANSYQLPSKVVEYARTGKPVLNLAAHAADSSASFFADYPACLNLVRRSNEVAPEHVEAVLDFISKRHTTPAEVLENFLAPFRVDRVAQRYEDIINLLKP